MLVKKDHDLVLMQDPSMFRMLLLKCQIKLAFQAAQFSCGVFCISANILYATFHLQNVHIIHIRKTVAYINGLPFTY